MRKLVNGKVVEVNNIELFELAAEGMALQKTAISNTSEGLEAKIDSLLVRRYIKQYDIFFKYMPYPLYAVESDIKYATLGNCMKSMSKETLEMWINKGLHVKLDKTTGMTLKIVNNTWSIVYDKADHDDNTSLELYKDEVGYKEYSWVLKKVINKESTGSFYEEFMPEFIKACNHQSFIMKWELENMLTFGVIPNRMEFKPNKILDSENEEEYSLDIYCTGTVETEEESRTWSISSAGLKNSSRKKQVKTYGFDAYSKSISEDANEKDGKISQTKLIGLNSMFLELCGFKSAKDMKDFPKFTGVIDGANLIFTIENRLYICKTSRFTEAKDIAHGVELYAVENGKVYFTKSKRVNERINKDMLYSYSMRDGSVRLCKVIFSY